MLFKIFFIQMHPHIKTRLKAFKRLKHSKIKQVPHLCRLFLTMPESAPEFRFPANSSIHSSLFFVLFTQILYQIAAGVAGRVCIPGS